jgi:hypothetical protein
MSVRISGNESPQRSEGYQRINGSSKDHEDSHYGHKESGLCEVDVEKIFVRLVVEQCEAESSGSLVFIFFAHIFS